MVYFFIVIGVINITLVAYDLSVNVVYQNKKKINRNKWK